MTNQERLVSLLGFAPSDNSAEGALLDAGIDKEADYVPASLVAIKTAAIGIMEQLLTSADTGSGVVGWTAKYDRTAVLARIKLYKSELGLSDESQPVIRGLKVW